MQRIFGLDIGTTSIGFAVIDHDRDQGVGRIHRLGARIFPEARDEKGTPLNQHRRQKRLARRQLRRRRLRRKALNELLSARGMLPRFGTSAWHDAMALDPYALRARGTEEALQPVEVGRALYHLAQRRHFKPRDEAAEADEQEVGDQEAETKREKLLQALRRSGRTLGQELAARGPHERKRHEHALRSTVETEFERLLTAQARHHEILRDPEFVEELRETIFAQRPVFWRTSTLGTCPFVPGAPLCPKGAWLSRQRRMLEQVNNLAITGGNARPLDHEERRAILAVLQTQASMSWGAVRTALKPLFKARGEAGAERRLRFNLEEGGGKTLLGNPLEAKLARIFGEAWATHPHRDAIRETIHDRLFAATYNAKGAQRIVILPASQRAERMRGVIAGLQADFGLSHEQAMALAELPLTPGWEPYSSEALRALMPKLEEGVRFGALVVAPEWEDWREATFPQRERPTGEVLDLLPSPKCHDESRRQTRLRNPTVLRTQNELRKVVNNLIRAHGKPDIIRVEVAREVGLSKREREDRYNGMRRQERQRQAAIKDLQAKGFAEPSRADVEKWLLWKESKETCPYTGDKICFDALFRRGEFQVEHIWPRSRSFDDSFRNKTLCRRDVNLAKGNQTPFEFFESRPEEWEAVKRRLDGLQAKRAGGEGMARGKVKRFVASTLPDDFAQRQLNDTGWAAREAVAFLKRLWPDEGQAAPVRVQAVTGRVTAQLRHLGGLDGVLSDGARKTRDDHRHHAVDALVVACTHPGMTERLSRYWQQKEDERAERPQLDPPWPTIRADAEAAKDLIVVSHRVRKKISGPFHKETVYGATDEREVTRGLEYEKFVTRKRVEDLTKSMLADIRDDRVRQIVTAWVAERGGDPKKAFPPYPTLGSSGPEIRKVRVLIRRQPTLMARAATGFADLGANHHVAIYKTADERFAFEVVSLLEVARRVDRGEPPVKRQRGDEKLVMSLAQGDLIRFAKTPDAEAAIWRVQKIATKGQISLLHHDDASPKEPSLFEPMVGGLMARNPEKLAVDPIGRVRKAGD